MIAISGNNAALSTLAARALALTLGSTLALGAAAAQASTTGADEAEPAYVCQENAQPGDGNLERVSLYEDGRGTYRLTYDMYPGGEYPDNAKPPEEIHLQLATKLSCKFSEADERLVSCRKYKDGGDSDHRTMGLDVQSVVTTDVDHYSGETNRRETLNVTMYSPFITKESGMYPDEPGVAKRIFHPDAWEVKCGRVK